MGKRVAIQTALTSKFLFARVAIERRVPRVASNMNDQPFLGWEPFIANTANDGLRGIGIVPDRVTFQSEFCDKPFTADCTLEGSFS